MIAAPHHPPQTVDPQDTDLRQTPALNKSMAHFARPRGANILSRTESYREWHDVRREAGNWQHTRCMTGTMEPVCALRDENGKTREGINFTSQNYLSLASHPAIIEAAVRAVREWGPHSAGSPMLTGNSDLSLALERALSEALHLDHVVLFPTGWGAGFGTVAGLIRADDWVVMDNLAHNCLQTGAQAVTKNILRHEHLNIEAAREHLRDIRSKDTKNGILVISEGLFSMDSDSPDLLRLQNVCREYDATLLVDIAHDFGALGPNGTGHIGIQNLLGKIDLVMGAFSKTFATNGGFLATNSRAAKQFVKAYGGSHIFSTALSPVQAAVAIEGLRIVRSPEGDLLRARLLRVVETLRTEFALHGIRCIGDPSAIVPVPIGSEKVARLAYRSVFERNVLANMVEFPAVAVGAARFRMQVMAAHTEEHARQAARVVAGAIQEARAQLGLFAAPEGSTFAFSPGYKQREAGAGGA